MEIFSGGPVNTTFYANPEVDVLIDQAAASVEMVERLGLYRQIHGIVTKDAPIDLALFETLHDLTNNNVASSAITLTLGLHMENIGFTE